MFNVVYNYKGNFPFLDDELQTNSCLIFLKYGKCTTEKKSKCWESINTLHLQCQICQILPMPSNYNVKYALMSFHINKHLNLSMVTHTTNVQENQTFAALPAA